MAKSPLVSFTFFCLLALVFAMKASGGDPANEKFNWVQQISKTYSAAKSLKALVKKDLTYKYYGKPKSYEGELILKGNNLRLELKGQEHSLLLMKDDQITQVTFPPEEDKSGKVRVLTAVLDRDAEAYRLMASLLKGEGLQDSFELVSSNEEGGAVVYQLKPKSQESEFSKLVLTVGKDKGLIREFTYWDNLGNKVSYKFKNVEFNKKIKDKVFEYKVPKDAERTTFQGA